MGTEIAAAASDDDAANGRPAAKAFFTFAVVDAMLQLKLALLARRIDVIGDRGAARADCFVQNVLHGAIELAQFPGCKVRSSAARMDFRAEEGLVRVDVAHAAKDGLVEEQGFDVRFARVQRGGELRLRSFEGIEAERAEDLRLVGAGQNGHTSEAANVGVTQFAAVIEREENVRVRPRGSFRGVNDELAGHTEVYEERKLLRTVTRAIEFDNEEFAVAAHLLDACAAKVAFERSGIVNEIGLPQAHAHYAAAGQDGSQAADYSLNFRQLRHDKNSTSEARKSKLGTRQNRKGKREKRSQAPTANRGSFRLIANDETKKRTTPSAGLSAVCRMCPS
jgi:hypothetical protein